MKFTKMITYVLFREAEMQQNSTSNIYTIYNDNKYAVFTFRNVAEALRSSNPKLQGQKCGAQSFLKESFFATTVAHNHRHVVQ